MASEDEMGTQQIGLTTSLDLEGPASFQPEPPAQHGWFFDLPALPRFPGQPRAEVLSAVPNVLGFFLIPVIASAAMASVSLLAYATFLLLFASVCVYVLVRIGQGDTRAREIAETMGRRAMYEAYAAKRLLLPLIVISSLWLGFVMLLWSRNQAFYKHHSLATYVFGSRLRAAVLNTAIHTHDYLTLRQAGDGQASGQYVSADIGYWGSSEWSQGELKAAPSLSEFSGQLQGSVDRFYIFEDLDWMGDRPRPRPINTGDRVVLLAGNRKVVSCSGSGGSAEAVTEIKAPNSTSNIPETAFFTIRNVANAGQIKAGEESWLSNEGNILGVREDGRVGCFWSCPDIATCDARGLTLDKLRAHEPELVFDRVGAFNSSSSARVSLREALNRTYLLEHSPAWNAAGDAEVELAVALSSDSIGRVEWPVGALPVLSDTGFQVFEDLEEDGDALEASEFLQTLCVAVVPTAFAAAAMVWPFRIGRSSCGRPGIFVLVARIVRVICMAYVLRVLTFMSTSIPGGRAYCQPSWNGGQEDLNHPPPISIGWNPFLDRQNTGANCGDNVFSGHSTNVMSSFSCIAGYAWALARPPDASASTAFRLTLLYAAFIAGYLVLMYFQFFYILSVRNHYTMDVTVAIYTAPLVYILDSQVLFPEDSEAPEDLTLGQLLGDGWSYIPLPMVWLDKLRSRRGVAAPAGQSQ